MPSGDSCCQAAPDGLQDLSVYCLNSTSEIVVGLQGPKGDKGDKGDTGAQGPQGIAGTNGINGVNGTNGTQGPKGDTGAAGSQGLQGVPGTNGSKGDTGAQGIAGTQGPIGPTGHSGSQGPRGPQGIPGANSSVDLTPINSNISSLNQRMSILESWKQTIATTIQDIWNSIFGVQNAISVLENQSGNMTIPYSTFPNYFTYLSSTDRKNIVCGYAQDNHLTQLNDLGWNCTITYKINQYTKKETSTCRCTGK